MIRYDRLIVEIPKIRPHKFKRVTRDPIEKNDAFSQIL